MPPPEFDNNEKSDVLHAMELALSLEKLVNEKLLNLPFVQDFGFLVFMLLDESQVADKNNDDELQDFVEREFLEKQEKNEIIQKQLDGFLYPKRQKID
nr:ferritin-3, chloroplastic-like [Ipomoea batatas]